MDMCCEINAYGAHGAILVMRNGMVQHRRRRRDTEGHRRDGRRQKETEGDRRRPKETEGDRIAHSFCGIGKLLEHVFSAEIR